MDGQKREEVKEKTENKGMGRVIASSPEDGGEKEIEEAAGILCFMKHAKVDQDEFAKLQLQKMIAKYRARKKPSESSSSRNRACLRRQRRPVQAQAVQELPGIPQEDLMALAQWRPPPLPPIESILPIMGRRSLPFCKQLTESDTASEQNRLAVHKSDMEKHIQPLLTEEELEIFKKGEEVAVEVYDSVGVCSNLKLKMWKTKTTVVMGGWITFVKDHSLRAHEDFVCTWGFRNRETGALSFAITSRRFPFKVAVKDKELDACRRLVHA